MQNVIDPSPDAPRSGDISLLITLPDHYGKPSDAVKTAQEIKRILQTGLHSRITVKVLDDGQFIEVTDREYRKVV